MISRIWRGSRSTCFLLLLIHHTHDTCLEDCTSAFERSQSRQKIQMLNYSHHIYVSNERHLLLIASWRWLCQVKITIFFLFNFEIGSSMWPNLWLRPSLYPFLVFSYILLMLQTKRYLMLLEFHICIINILNFLSNFKLYAMF